MMVLQLQFHSQKNENITIVQNRQVRRVRDHNHVFHSQKLLHLNSNVHWSTHSEVRSSCSTIV
jgi:hypothetical protein